MVGTTTVTDVSIDSCRSRSLDLLNDFLSATRFQFTVVQLPFHGFILTNYHAFALPRSCVTSAAIMIPNKISEFVIHGE